MLQKIFYYLRWDRKRDIYLWWYLNSHCYHWVYPRKIGAKTIFATHYHELTQLEEKLEKAENFRIEVKEDENEIIFLREIVKGGADKSYGIEVARLAGLPKEILDRSKAILKRLEERKEIVEKI